MRIVVMSDTHGNYPLALRACDQAGGADAIIHLGDGCDDAAVVAQVAEVEVIGVAGNCDHRRSAPRELLWECQGKRILLLHGDQYRVKSGLERLEQHARSLGVDAVLYGHTHDARIEDRGGILFVNPGTLMKSGTPTSFALLEITPDGLTARLEPIDPLP